MSIKFEFNNKRFVVTGASSGIGNKIANELAKAGANVFAIARRENKLKELQEKYPDNIEIAAIDVTNFDDLKTSLENYSKLGEIDGSLHAAGINKFTPLRVFDWKVAEQIIRTSLYAGIELVRILAQRNVTADKSSHILISSVAANEGPMGFTAYSAAKSGLLGAIRPMAMELASKNIRVNAISPGWITTEMTKGIENYYPVGIDEIIASHPLGIGSLEDVSNLALFLLSDESKWITGANIVIDGGYSVK